MATKRRKSYRSERAWLAENGFSDCIYCARKLTLGAGENMMTLDHVIPLSQGGKDDRSNFAPACVSCNQQKGAKSASTAFQCDGLTRKQRKDRQRAYLQRVSGVCRAIERRA